MGRFLASPPFREEYGCITKSCTAASGLCVTLGKKLDVEKPIEAQKCEDHILEQPVGTSALVFGVFDGHGGHLCCRTAGSKLVASAAELARSGPITSQALVSTFRRVDHDWCACPHSDDSGTTAALGVLRGNELTIGHVGDTRAILLKKDGSSPARRSRSGIRWDSSGSSCEVLTTDHTASNIEERELVISRGGYVPECSGSECPRVNGLIEVTRSLGDRSLKPILSCTPDVHSCTINADDSFLVVGSDGLFDKVDNATVASIVTREAGLGKPNSYIALSLAKMAYRNGSSDDISAYVLTLDDRWQGSAFAPSTAVAHSTLVSGASTEGAAFSVAPSTASVASSDSSSIESAEGLTSFSPAPQWSGWAMRGLQWGSCALVLSAMVICVYRSRRR